MPQESQTQFKASQVHGIPTSNILLEIPHVQGQRGSPSKTVGGAKPLLESNPIPARDAQGAQTYLVWTVTLRAHRD